MKRILIINIILIILIYVIPNRNITEISQAENIVEIADNIEIADTEPIIENPIIEETVTEVTSRNAEIREEDKSLKGYRVTSYYPADNYGSNNTTGSGKTTNDFTLLNVNGKTVYQVEIGTGIIIADPAAGMVDRDVKIRVSRVDLLDRLVVKAQAHIIVL